MVLVVHIGKLTFADWLFICVELTCIVSIAGLFVDRWMAGVDSVGNTYSFRLFRGDNCLLDEVNCKLLTIGGTVLHVLSATVILCGRLPVFLSFRHWLIYGASAVASVGILCFAHGFQYAAVIAIPVDANVQLVSFGSDMSNAEISFILFYVYALVAALCCAVHVSVYGLSKQTGKTEKRS